jgi:hypothetical protein
MRFKFFLILLGVVWLSGCGYTTNNNVYDSSDIYVVPVVNKIKVTGEGRLYPDYKAYPRLIENDLTNALVRRFNVTGRLSVTADTEKSMKLYCDVTSYEKTTLQYADEHKGEIKDEVKQQRLRLTTHARLIDGNGKILNERDVIGETTYYLYGIYAKTQDSAWLDLVDDTSRRIAEAVLENW